MGRRRTFITLYVFEVGNVVDFVLIEVVFILSGVSGGESELLEAGKSVLQDFCI